MDIEQRAAKRNGTSINEEERGWCGRLARLVEGLTSKPVMAARVMVRCLFVIINNMYCIPTFCVWMLLLQPLRFTKPDLYWRIEGTFFHWLLAMVSMWSWSAGYDIVEMGDDIRLCLDSRTLVLVNHQSTADVPMLMACFNAKKGVLPNIMWIMDRVFKFTNFGIVSIIHQDFFILSGRECRDKAITLLKDHLKDSYIPRKRRLMVLFPEGGFLRKRRETSRKYALKNNLPLLNNVSLPRMGAMHAIMDLVGPRRDSVIEPPELGVGVGAASPLSSPPSQPASDSSMECDDTLSWVLDITVAYPGGKPLDLPTIVTGSRKPCQTILLYRLFPSHSLPEDHDGITEWLISLWQDKERILGQFYETGEIPVDSYCRAPLPPQLVAQDNLRFLLLHLFFIASTYLHFKLIYYAVSLIW